MDIIAAKLKTLILWLAIGFAFAVAIEATGTPFPLYFAPVVGGGGLSWPSVSNGAYQVLSSTQLGAGWLAYPMTGAVLSASSTQLTVTVPTIESQRFFRGLYLGATNNNISVPLDITVTEWRVLGEQIS